MEDELEHPAAAWAEDFGLAYVGMAARALAFLQRFEVGRLRWPELQCSCRIRPILGQARRHGLHVTQASPQLAA